MQTMTALEDAIETEEKFARARAMQARTAHRVGGGTWGTSYGVALDQLAADHAAELGKLRRIAEERAAIVARTVVS